MCMETIEFIAIYNTSGVIHWTLLGAHAVCDLCLQYGVCRPRHTRLEVNRQTGVLSCIIQFMHSVCTMHSAKLLFYIRRSIVCFSRFFHSCIFHQIQHCAAFSSPAFSCLAFSAPPAAPPVSFGYPTCPIYWHAGQNCNGATDKLGLTLYDWRVGWWAGRVTDVSE